MVSRVSVRLQTEFDTGEGNHLAVTGDVPELGTWDPDYAVTCSCNDGMQTADVTLPADCVFEFKWILLDSDNQVLRWQEGENRKVVLPPDTGHVLVQAPWDDVVSVGEQGRLPVLSVIKQMVTLERNCEVVKSDRKWPRFAVGLLTVAVVVAVVAAVYIYMCGLQNPAYPVPSTGSTNTCTEMFF